MMKRSNMFLALAAIVALSLPSAAPSSAQDEPRQGQGQTPRPLDPSIKATFVPLGNGEPGVLYEPKNPGPKAQIAILAEHSALDYLTHSSCTELSKRGYRVFCVNNSNDKSRTFNDGSLDQVMLETKKAIIYLRNYPGVKKIVLWGHSGGATVMTAYQDTAENGVAACQEAAKIYKCPNSLAGTAAGRRHHPRRRQLGHRERCSYRDRSVHQHRQRHEDRQSRPRHVQS